MPPRQVCAALSVVGKRQQAAPVATLCAVNDSNGRSFRLFVRDRKTKMQFLVDSGADVSVLPAKKHIAGEPSNFKLYAANGSEIPTYGTKLLNLDLGLRRQFEWPFIIANTNKGILGADFLHHFDLLIDLKKKQLIDNKTKLCISANITEVTAADNLSTIQTITPFTELLKKFPDLTKPTLVPTDIRHEVRHYISTTSGPPVFGKARRLDPDRLKQAKQEFQFMLDHNIIRPSDSAWASPLHMVKKKNGTWRCCGDYRRLNDRTIPDRYPLPHIGDVNQILGGKTIFSKIDLLSAYHQIPMAEEDKPKSAIITPFGLFEYNFMPFGLKNAPATFQRFINSILMGLDFCFAYLDDILIASSTLEQHKEHLLKIFERLNNNGIKINVAKSEFGKNEIIFLGHQITTEGTKPDPEKVNAILNYQRPKTIRELRRFLGSLNFYRRFIKNAADRQAILNNYLKGAKKKDNRPIDWTEESIKQFELCKQDVINAATLTCPSSKFEIGLFVDASDHAIGAVLQQNEELGWRPIGFYSKKLSEAEKKYSTYDRELLSMYKAVKYFRQFVEGRIFTIYTDHKPLIFAFKQSNEKATPRQLRHLHFISQFSTDVRHIAGTENQVADYLSRLGIEEINYEQIAQSQQGDVELENLIRSNTSLKLIKYPLSKAKTLWCDVSLGNIRPVIPESYRQNVFKMYHDLAHPGPKATAKLIASKCVWPKMEKEIREWAKACIPCQKSKISRHVKSPIGEFPKTTKRFEAVHIDLVGPLPQSEGYSYCLTCIDRFSSWVEVIPLKSIDAETVAKKFFKEWISRFGTPVRIHCDQGRQFQSELFHSLANICGCRIQRSTPYHPQAQGKIERFHRTLKAAIRTHGKKKWTEILPTILLGIRSAIKLEANASIAEMIYGQPLRLPGDFFSEIEETKREDRPKLVQDLRSWMQGLKPMGEKLKSSSTTFVYKDLRHTSHVFVRVDRLKPSLVPPYEGPFQVVERQDKFFTLEIDGKRVNISVDRLKPAYLLGTDDEPEDTDGTEEQETRPSEDTTVPKTRSGRTVRFPSRFLRGE